MVKKTGRDNRFIAYSNGTVLDTQTKLIWAAKDNGSDITWAEAKSFCENYHSGGYTDWRMPTMDELLGLYDLSKSRPVVCNRRFNIHVATELIDITYTSLWASETRGSETAYFDLVDGSRGWIQLPTDDDYYFGFRALPVSCGKKNYFRTLTNFFRAKETSPKNKSNEEGEINFTKYPILLNEIEALDTVFRLKFTDEERRVKQPFQFHLFDNDSMDIMKRLDRGEIPEEQALIELTVLMERYYGQKYSLS